MKLQLVHFTGWLMRALEVEAGDNSNQKTSAVRAKSVEKENVGFIRRLDENPFIFM
jgi:hypothetical protein